jgi:hypothetical protein
MDPERLRNKYSGELEGSLLASARDDAPSGRARGRTLAALGFGGLAAGLPTATTTAAAAKTVSSVSLAAALKWGSIGLAAGALTVGGVHQAPRWLGTRDEAKVALSHRGPQDSKDRSAVPARPLEETLPQAQSDIPAPEVTVPGAVATRSNPETLPRTQAASPLFAPQVNRDEPKLAEEVAALDRARQMVPLHPEAAIELLDAYDRSFPHGDLAPEALVLRIDALVRSGRRAAAEALGAAYLAAHPRSPHAQRIRAMIGGGPEAAPSNTIAPKDEAR